jgi:hypothetical protein
MSVTLNEVTGGGGGVVGAEGCDSAPETKIEEPSASPEKFDIYSAMMQPILTEEEPASSVRPRERPSGEGVDVVELRAKERQLEQQRQRGLRKSEQAVQQTAVEREQASEALAETRESRVASGATNNVRWRHEAGLSARQDLINDRRSITRRNLRLELERRADRSADERRRADRSWQDRRR